MESIGIRNRRARKTVFKFLLTKQNAKCTQTNKRVVLSDSKSTWSNENQGYINITIQ